MQAKIMQFVIENIELVVFVLGGGASALFITSKRVLKYNDDVSKYLIQIKKHQEGLNKRSKSVM